ncbi:IS1634 family transposase [Pelodictyon phaeoclathratiforme]|uniref:Transposase IS4 family protein n=1 Tax=Pelodictyon phaeoclathratiforme (strain DSM 5477 / BU-1) TaxID=324925 RepID=B4SBT6_PELPB|nr:transposase [Pelodictyon phaeoclathratiforme]ACF42611.1 transposase IS4 family protein [Pelodictyon phaeoclathratiforme BU-1]
MSKPVTGKTHVGERRERRPNGDIYIYERVTGYNERTRKTYTVSQKLQGKIKSGTQEIIPTRPKKSKNEGGLVGALRRHSGLTDLLEWVGKASGIDDDVRSSFSEGDAAKILSIARYWIGSGGNTLPRLEGWQVMHSLPYSEVITEDVYSDLFKCVGCDEDRVQRYFSFRADRLGKAPVLAFDSTTISTYSENQSEARHGFNKDGDGLKTIKLLTLYSVKEREPLAFAKQPGNVPDVISIENTLKQLKCFNLEKPLIVTDNGYYSEGNMMKFALRNMKFLTLVDPNITWVRETVDALRETLAGMSSTCQFDPSVCGATAMRMHEFGRVRQLSRNGKLSGEEERFVRRLYVHVFYSPNSDTKKQLDFRKELFELKAQVEDGVMEFTKSAQRKIERYLICSKKGRGGQLRVGFNDKAIVEATKYFGYFALVSNQAMKTFTALADYRLREKIEEIFAVVKGGLDGARPRTWHPDNLRGRQFVQFVSLGYHCFLTKKIKEMRAELGKNGSEKTKALVNLEKKLEQWLEQRSLAQILDWFDCIETTQVRTVMGNYRWSTESVARDRLFLKYLGVTS